MTDFACKIEAAEALYVKCGVISGGNGAKKSPAERDLPGGECVLVVICALFASSEDFLVEAPQNLGYAIEIHRFLIKFLDSRVNFACRRY